MTIRFFCHKKKKEEWVISSFLEFKKEAEGKELCLKYYLENGSIYDVLSGAKEGSFHCLHRRIHYPLFGKTTLTNNFTPSAPLFSMLLPEFRRDCFAGRRFIFCSRERDAGYQQHRARGHGVRRTQSH